MNIKFELDEYYFNRAGVKVRYVGYDINNDKAYIRVEANSSLYKVCFTDGSYSETGAVHDGDILGKWEITDDPNRVYVVDGKKYRLFDNSEWLKNYADKIEKILIAPYFKPRVCFDCAEVEKPGDEGMHICKSREVLFNGELV